MCFFISPRKIASQIAKPIPLETADINVLGSVNVFDAAHRVGVSKVVYAETSALYEGQHDAAHAGERTRPAKFLRR